MRINGAPWRTIWVEDDGTVAIIDQTRLPHELVVESLRSLADAVAAIDHMQVRGAPLIGATAAYGMALAMADDPGEAALRRAADTLLASRPTAVNLRWAVEKLYQGLLSIPEDRRPAKAMAMAGDICQRDVAVCESIGRHGLELIRAIAAGKREGEAVNILTHCNAGWLATVDWGTATAPVYKAFAAGIPLHVWVDETRPRNQGASLTAWELGAEGIAHSLIVDNAGGHLMQQGLVDLCIVGTDRTTAAGDVANKIGTYLKALAAHDNGVPFYVALPSSTIDWRIEDGLRDIPIEERSPREVTHISGLLEGGDVATVALAPPETGARNPAFDVTPARLVSGLITERGVIGASRAALAAAFGEMAQKGRPA